MFWTVFLHFVWTVIWIAFWASNTEVRVKWTSPNTPGNYTKPSDALKMYIDSTQFHQLTSIILWVVPDYVQNKNQLFCTTATKQFCPQLHTGNQLLILLPCAFYLLISAIERLYWETSWNEKPFTKKSPHVNVVVNYSVCTNQPIP